MVFMECLKRYSTKSKFPGVGRNYPPLPLITQKNGSFFFSSLSPRPAPPLPRAARAHLLPGEVVPDRPAASIPFPRRVRPPPAPPLPRRARPSRARPPSLTSRWCPLAPHARPPPASSLPVRRRRPARPSEVARRRSSTLSRTGAPPSPAPALPPSPALATPARPRAA
jgi:hypothetical protein